MLTMMRHKSSRFGKLWIIPIICLAALAWLIFLGSSFKSSEAFQRSKSPIKTARENVIRHCITQEVMATYDSELGVEDFSERMRNNKTAMESGMTGEKRQSFFVETYKKKIWGGDDMDKAYNGLKVSGLGSTLQFAQETMASLHILINQWKKDTGNSYVRILDLPCGDLQWMHRFLKGRADVVYTGMDIVPEIIEHHKKTFVNANWTFALQDAVLLKTLPGSFDIIICRHMLQHLVQKDVLKVLTMFSSTPPDQTPPSYFFTTNHYYIPNNRDLNPAPGASRYVNLELPPYLFAPPICVVKECVDIPHEHLVAIYRMPFQVVAPCAVASANLWRERNEKLYSCVAWK